MTRRIKMLSVLLAFVLCVTAVFAAIPYRYLELSAAVDTSKDAEEALKAKISALQSEQTELKNKISAAESDITQQSGKKQYLDSLVASTHNEIDATEQLIAEYDAKIQQKTEEISVQQAAIDTKYDEMMDRLRFSYEEGTASYLELILSSSTITDFLSGVDRVSIMMDFDRSLMSELSAQLQVLNDEKTVLDNTRAEQTQLQDTLTQKKADLEQQSADVSGYIQQLQSDESAYWAQYEKAKAAEEAAGKEVEKLLAERQKSQNNQFWGGDFIWPTTQSNRRISSPFGWRTLWGRSDNHRGIDIPGKRGDDIYASCGGTVVTATSHSSWGNYILIDHGGGFATLYAHNTQLLVSKGDTVQQGQLIARMGDSGNAEGVHCHFEFYVNGKLVNPLSYVKQP